MEHSKLVIRHVNGRWVLGSGVSYFERFEKRELAVARAKKLTEAYPDTEVVIIDAKGSVQPLR